ncbi:MAG TPA: signal peptidase I [Candidatus Dormibacteraeota bacterium]|nr:signal peptidase I [Candidatus Dormibacteraeota bacterium]
MTAPSPYDAPPPYELAAKPSTERRTLGCLFEIVETLVLTVAIFFVIQTFVAQPYQVRQMSMEHTLEPNDYVLVDKLTPRFDTYKRGDVVVFEPPPDWATGGDRTPFIKRVIGLAGDTIELRDGHVVVNGNQLQEPYLFTQDGVSQPTDPTAGQSRWTVPQGELFVMGDHREASADSRTFGPVPVSSVVGRAWLRYWPVSKLGILSTPRYDVPSTSSLDQPWQVVVLLAARPRASLAA